MLFDNEYYWPDIAKFKCLIDHAEAIVIGAGPDFSGDIEKQYYAMKNYLQNTNGAEYLGTVNISDGLESHVYDKDGKQVIITWSENSTNNIQIDYKDFTAKDLYGKDIQPDENGKLTITTSPVYLYEFRL